MMSRSLIATIAFAIATPLLANQAPEQKEDQSRDESEQKIVGSYSITEGAKDGEKIPADRLKDSTVAITKDTIAVVDRDQKKLYSASYQLSRGGESGLWKIDLESQVPKEGAKAIGLLKQDGQQLWLIYSLADEKSLTNAKRPTGFDKTEQGQHLFKMKRQTKAPTLNQPAEKDER